MIKIVGIIAGFAALYLAVSYAFQQWAGKSVQRQIVLSASLVAIGFAIADYLIGPAATFQSFGIFFVLGGALGAVLPLLVSRARALLEKLRSAP